MNIRRVGNITGLLGLLILAAGSVTYAIKGQFTTPLIIFLWVGALFVLFSLYTNIGNIRDALSGRSIRYGANMAVIVGVFLSILIIISAISARNKKRVDLTKTGRYTLSDQSIKIVKSLKRDVETLAFYRQDQRTRQAMFDLLQEYSYHSPRFTYRFIDPDRNPEETLRYGITEYRVTLIRSGNSQEKVGFESEEKITNAILRVMRDEVKTIYFLKGHGENDTSSQDKDGYRAAKEAIEKENFNVKEIVLLSEKEVPADASVLVVSGSKKEFLPEELERLSKYIKKGGGVLLMVDPGAPPGLINFTKQFGFKIGDDIIIDKLSQVFGANYLTPVVTEYSKDHPLTKEFNVATFFPLARSVEIENNPREGTYTLAMTSDNSWAETNLGELEKGRVQYQEGRDRPGPVPLAAVAAIKVGGEETGHVQHQGSASKPAAEIKSTKDFAKIVVFGDSDFANNTHINLTGNKDLFLNTINWLAEEAELISIRKRNPENTPVVLTAAQGRLIFWIPVIVIPFLIMVLGIGVYTRRRWGG